MSTKLIMAIITITLALDFIQSVYFQREKVVF